MFLKSFANERGSIYLSPLGRHVRGFEEFRIENNLDGFHCGAPSTVYSTVLGTAGEALSGTPIPTQPQFGNRTILQTPPIRLI